MVCVTASVSGTLSAVSTLTPRSDLTVLLASETASLYPASWSEPTMMKPTVRLDDPELEGEPPLELLPQAEAVATAATAQPIASHLRPRCSVERCVRLSDMCFPSE